MNIIKSLEVIKKEARTKDYEIVFVQLDDGGKGVFKASTSVDKISCIKEKLAYDIARYMNIDIIPETDLIKYNGRFGSIQRYVENSISGFESVSKKTEWDMVSFQELAVFDFITGNYDRWLNNVRIGIGEDNYGKVYGIDHGSILMTRYISGISLRAILFQKPTEEVYELIKYCSENKEQIVELLSSIKYKLNDRTVCIDKTFKDSANMIRETISILANSVEREDKVWKKNILEMIEEVGKRDKSGRWYQGGIDLPYNLKTPEIPGYSVNDILKELELRKEDFKGARVLDCCCGSGYYVIYSIKLGAKEAVGFDVDEQLIDAAIKLSKIFKVSKKVNFYTKTFETIIYEIKDFDIMMLNSCIYHTSEPKKILDMIGKNTKKLLVLYTQFWTCPNPTNNGFGYAYPDLVKRYVKTPEEVEEDLKRYGFKRFEYSGAKRNLFFDADGNRTKTDKPVHAKMCLKAYKQ